MIDNLISWTAFAWQLLLKNSGWMAWNLFLALVPLALSVVLFCQPRSRSRWWWVGLLLIATFLPRASFALRYGVRFIVNNRMNYFLWGISSILIVLDILLIRHTRRRSFFWWVGFLVFIAFLPNAPYVVTDIIHLIGDIRKNYPIWAISLVLIPQYLLFILVGMEAYVLSLINLGNYLQRQGWSKFIVGVELTIHVLSAIGIYLGRFLRFNSWDLVTEFDSVVDTAIDDLTAKFPVMVMIISFAIIIGLYWLGLKLTFCL